MLYMLPVFPKLFYLWNPVVVLKKKSSCVNKRRSLFITSRVTVLVRNICPSRSNYTCVILYANNNQVRNQELLSERCFLFATTSGCLQQSPKSARQICKFLRKNGHFNAIWMTFARLIKAFVRTNC